MIISNSQVIFTLSYSILSTLQLRLLRNRTHTTPSPSSSLIRRLPHLNPSQMTRFKHVPPLSIKLRQHSPWLSWFRLSSQRPHGFKIILEIRIQCCERNAIAFIGDPVLLPRFSSFNRRELCAACEKSCREDGLPFVDLEGKSSGNLLDEN